MTDTAASDTRRGPRSPAGAALFDIALVFAASGLAFLAERWGRDQGYIPLGEDSTGLFAVLAGTLTALALVFVRGQSLAHIGFRRPERAWTVPLWVLGILVAFVAGQTLLPMLISRFVELPAPDLSRYDNVYHNLPAALIMLLALPLTASIPEEIIYRGFLMDRVNQMFGWNARGTVLAVILPALLFASAHFQWGVGGMAMTTVIGIVWGTAFVLCGRNLWIVILAHSAGHVLLVIQLYFQKASEMGAAG
jgi:membrane protease YdiL (CAAX protease family)